jgi:hypothetical protein
MTTAAAAPSTVIFLRMSTLPIALVGAGIPNAQLSIGHLVTPSLPIRLDRTTAASRSRPLERSKTTSLRLTLRARAFTADRAAADVGGEPFVVVIDP